MRKILFILMLLGLSGCALTYHPPIQQGNVLDADKVSQLRLGMSGNQVQQLLGTPVLTNTFRNDEYDYVYSYYRYTKPLEEKNLILKFRGGRLAAIDKSGY